MVGAPPVEIALPSWETNWACPWTDPAATSTPGTRWIRGRIDSGMGLRSAPAPVVVSWATPRTWKSMFW